MPALLVSGMSTAATFIEQLFDSRNKSKKKGKSNTKSKGSGKKRTGLVAGFTALVGGLKKKVQHLEQQNKQDILTIKSVLNNLKKQGYSKQVIKVYESNLKSRIKNGKIGNLTLSSYISESQKVGSKDFKQIFNDSGLTAKQKLEFLIKSLNMPTGSISKDPQAVQQMISKFSNTSPDDKFWGQLSNAAQTTFKGPVNKDEDKLLASQINQLRYLISAQQAQYIRDNYGKPNDTDEQKLVDYLSGQPKRGTDEKREPVKYEQEQAPLHQKMKNGKYPKGYSYANFKVTINFHSEFIIDGKGNFVNEAEPEPNKITENGVVNGASFNYANKVSAKNIPFFERDLHKDLDKDIKGLEPEWRQSATEDYDAPDTGWFKKEEYAVHSDYDLDDKTAKQREDELFEKFKKQVEEQEKIK
jgi:hypothetical protein